MRARAGDQWIALDHADGELCFVSHAHGDHTRGLRAGKPVIASEATLALSGYEKAARCTAPGLSLLNAGHILGSNQLVVDGDGQRLIFTGDLRLEDGLTTKGAESLACDTLVIEATFGSPEFVFPPREEIYDAISFWVRQKLERGCIVFGAYSVGKAQELIKLLNERCGIAPFVHPRIERACKVYEAFGVRLDRIPIAQEAMSSNFIAILPFREVTPSLARNLQATYNKRFFTSLVTGWALRFRYPVDVAFPLSDHAGFDQLIEYVERAAPKRVFTAFGYDERLAAELRKRGFNASPAKEVGLLQAAVR